MPDGPAIRNSTRLRRKIALISPKLHAVAAAIWNHPRFPEVYPDYLFTNHAVVRASVPLMKAALDCAEKSWAHDPVARGLADYLAHHIPEEMHHDEWLLEDLQVLGFDAGTVQRRAPPPAVATLVGAQYYWIFHYHPVMLLGYIAVLEGTPPDEHRIGRVATRTGVPLQAFSTLIRHARLDPHHRDDLDRVLDTLPLTESHAALLGVSAFHTVCWLATAVMEAISDRSLPNTPASAPSGPADTRSGRR
jgi:hypothetical protein